MPSPPFPPRSPPGPPPPGLPPPVVEPQLAPLSVNTTRRGAQTAILGAISGATGFDVEGYLDSFFGSYVQPSKFKPVQVMRWVERHSACPHESLYTDAGGPDRLAQEFTRTAWQLTLGCSALSFLFGSTFFALVSFATALASFAFLPLWLSRTYDVSILCFARLPPLLPGRFADDAFDILNQTLLPRHFNWPNGLSPDGWARVPSGAFALTGEPLTRLASAPLDCGADPTGMTDGFRVAAWYLQQYYPGWRRFAPLYSLQTLVGTPTLNKYAFYYLEASAGAQHLTDVACARFMVPNVALVFVLSAIAVGALPILSNLVLVVFRHGLVLVGSFARPSEQE